MPKTLKRVSTTDDCYGYKLRLLQGIVMRLIKKTISLEEIAVIKLWVGEETARAIDQFGKEWSSPPPRTLTLMLVTVRTYNICPFQTCLKSPGRDVSRAHLDMGAVAVIAANRGIITMGNFRVRFCSRTTGLPDLCTTRPVALQPPYKEPRSTKYWWHNRLVHIARR